MERASPRRRGTSPRRASRPRPGLDGRPYAVAPAAVCAGDGEVVRAASGPSRSAGGGDRVGKLRPGVAGPGSRWSARSRARSSRRPSAPRRQSPGAGPAAAPPGWPDRLGAGIVLERAVGAVEEERAERRYVATSAATSPTAASDEDASRSRARSDSRLEHGVRLQHVAGLAHRLDQRRAGGVQLAAKVAHVGLDDVRVAAEVVAPHVLEDLRLREHSAWVEQEEAEQGELGRRELDRRVAAEDLVARLVERRGPRSAARRRGARSPSDAGSPARAPRPRRG